jgi:branched-chain amino acid transport system permease protein
MAGAGLLALVLGYPCFRFRVVGHYFALVTLALGEVVRLLIIAERDWTGGSLGITLKDAGSFNLLAVQFADKRVFYFAALAVWLAGLAVWRRVDRSMTRSALEAIGEDEAAAAAVGVPVTRFKLRITLVSAALTALGGVLYGQYVTYLNPGTLAGIGVSLQIVFAAVVGGMYSLLGPTVGTALTIALAEYLRVAFGVKFLGMADTIYGLALILIIIFLPEGLYGTVRALVGRRAAPAAAAGR